MCQISVIVEKSEGNENVMDNVTSLEVLENGVLLTTFFEEPVTVSDVVISRIDFLGGKVFLSPAPHHGQ